MTFNWSEYNISFQYSKIQEMHNKVKFGSYKLKQEVLFFVVVTQFRAFRREPNLIFIRGNRIVVQKTSRSSSIAEPQQTCAPCVNSRQPRHAAELAQV